MPDLTVEEARDSVGGLMTALQLRSIEYGACKCDKGTGGCEHSVAVLATKMVLRENLDALIAAVRREAVRELVPDIVMGEDSEVGFPVSDLGDLADDLQLDPGEVQQVRCYRTLPDRWLAMVVVTRDSDGCPDDIEPQLFDSEADALNALAAPEKP